jgi:hypothetical protein
VIASTSSFLLPLICGRYLLEKLFRGLLPVNDVYCWFGGCFTLWIMFSASRWTLSTLFSRGNGGLLAVFKQCTEWIALACKWLVLVSVLGVLAPLLAGVLFELVVLDPWSVPADRTPTVNVIQDWTLGLALLKAWSRIVFLGAFGDSKWQPTLRQAQQQGVYGVQLVWMLRQVGFPIIRVLLLHLCIPYVLARLYAQAAGLDSIQAQHALRASFPALSLLLVLKNMFGATQTWIDAMHDMVFDHRYRVGRQLQNQ